MTACGYCLIKTFLSYTWKGCKRLSVARKQWVKPHGLASEIYITVSQGRQWDATRWQCLVLSLNQQLNLIYITNALFKQSYIWRLWGLSDGCPAVSTETVKQSWVTQAVWKPASNMWLEILLSKKKKRK